MNEEAQYRQITERLDRIERLTLIAAKPVLDLTEAAQFTGLSIGHLYRLTSSKQIPHFKKSRKLYFDKQELTAWLTDNRVPTEKEIDSRAATYVVTARNNARARSGKKAI
jgi:excisionase family DNA binding protein